jgi:hypothetical protein
MQERTITYNGAHCPNTYKSALPHTRGSCDSPSGKMTPRPNTAILIIACAARKVPPSPPGLLHEDSGKDRVLSMFKVLSRSGSLQHSSSGNCCSVIELLWCHVSRINLKGSWET